MKPACRQIAALVIGLCMVVQLHSAHAEKTGAVSGPGIKRIANMPDGAPAFVLYNAKGQATVQMQCIFNGYFNSDEFAAQILASRALMANILAADGKLSTQQLGPAIFDCVLAAPVMIKQAKSDLPSSRKPAA